jgi:hypothetical protein
MPRIAHCLLDALTFVKVRGIAPQTTLPLSIGWDTIDTTTLLEILVVDKIKVNYTRRILGEYLRLPRPWRFLEARFSHLASDLSIGQPLPRNLR